MRLWGKVASGLSLLLAAVFAAVAFFVPEARQESIAVAAILSAISLFGVPALVKVFSSFAGDEEILANGVAGFALRGNGFDPCA